LMFLASSQTFSPLLNGTKVHVICSAIRTLASSCAANASFQISRSCHKHSSRAGNFDPIAIRDMAIGL
jgi:hypothetical protein